MDLISTYRNLIKETPEWIKILREEGNESYALQKEKELEFYKIRLKQLERLDTAKD